MAHAPRDGLALAAARAKSHISPHSLTKAWVYVSLLDEDVGVDRGAGTPDVLRHGHVGALYLQRCKQDDASMQEAARQPPERARSVWRRKVKGERERQRDGLVGESHL